jgi:hypothetical protein
LFDIIGIAIIKHSTIESRNVKLIAGLASWVGVVTVARTAIATTTPFTPGVVAAWCR